MREADDAAAQAALANRLHSAIGTFFVEFAAFESICLDFALRALVVDRYLVDHLTELTDLDDRLTLLQRCADSWKVPEPLRKDLRTLTKRVRGLLEFRNDVATTRRSSASVAS